MYSSLLLPDRILGNDLHLDKTEEDLLLGAIV